ncbi:MAG: uroporphyrinogen-III synthase, partial [Roseivirga sp.]|nr:uroporphyrinogen-III synthase [Roseivirga sp.]
LAKKYGIKIVFRPFIQVDPIAAKEFRKQKIDILKHTAIIFTSRNAVDHFFAICKDLKIEVPADMKYFCISEQTAYYLQKYIVVRKRKIFTGSKTAQDLIEILKKHKNEKYLFPCSNIRKEDIPNYLEKNGYNFSEAVIYETVASDLSDLDDVTYDILAFYSPSGINSLFVNFPEFKQNDTRIAVFGPTTAQAAKEANLEIDIEAPQPNAPSMTGALELYIKKANNL